jgi:hypothetical protein
MRLSDDMHPITGTNLKFAVLYASREVAKAWLAVAGGLGLVAVFIIIGYLIFTGKYPDYRLYTPDLAGAIFLCKIAGYISLGYWVIQFLMWFNNPPMGPEEDDDWWWYLNDDNK